jgi:hypothetical protein
MTGIGLPDIAFGESGERGMWIGLRETSVSKATDRGAERGDRIGSPEDQAIDQDVIEGPKDEPFGTPRRADEGVEELRMEAFVTYSLCCDCARTDDEIPGGQGSLPILVLPPTPPAR